MSEIEKYIKQYPCIAIGDKYFASEMERKFGIDTFNVDEFSWKISLNSKCQELQNKEVLLCYDRNLLLVEELMHIIKPFSKVVLLVNHPISFEEIELYSTIHYKNICLEVLPIDDKLSL